MKSYQQPPSRKSKKRESAIKGKENKPVACSKGLFACERPRDIPRAKRAASAVATGVRVGIRKRLIEAAVEDALVAFCGTRGKPGEACDQNLWAKFAWRFGWGMLRELTLQGVAEMREHRRPIEDRDKPKVLQRLINGVWKDSKRTTAREAKRGGEKRGDAEVAAVRTGNGTKGARVGRFGSIGSDRADVGSNKVGVVSSKVCVVSSRVGVGSNRVSVASESGDGKDSKRTTAREAV